MSILLLDTSENAAHYNFTQAQTAHSVPALPPSFDPCFPSPPVSSCTRVLEAP